MQYLLTEAEYTALKNQRTEALKAKDHLRQEFCTLVADTMPVKTWKNGGEPAPWGCILTVRKRTGGHDWYCDECPAQDFCPYPNKDWSK